MWNLNVHLIECYFLLQAKRSIGCSKNDYFGMFVGKESFSDHAISKVVFAIKSCDLMVPAS